MRMSGALLHTKRKPSGWLNASATNNLRMKRAYVEASQPITELFTGPFRCSQIW